MKKIKLSLFLQILSVGLLASTLVFSQSKPDDSEMIFLRASVIDSKGNAVENLKQEQFNVKEDGIEQEIKYFSDRKEPASVLIILDVSGSVNKLIREINAAQALSFIQNNPENDYSIVSFNDKVAELADWGSSRQQLTDSVNKTIETKKLKGNTAFFDAFLYALEKFKSSRHEKKALLIFSDGYDNASKKGFSSVLKELKKSDLSVFTISLLAPEHTGVIVITSLYFDEIDKFSGGKSYYTQTKEETEKAVKHVELILNNQYVIGYIPKIRQKDRDWHKIAIKVSGKDEKGKNLKSDVIARNGYAAAKQ